MPKPNPLAQGLEQITRRPAETALPRDVDRPPVRAKTAPSRSGRVLVGGFFTPEVQTALKIIAAEERTTLQALLTEAINTVFAHRGRPEIAGLSAKPEEGRA